MALTKVPSNLDAAISVTQSAGDNSTKVATTSYVDTAIAALSDSAPAALNTLNEIAAALGDDANYASTTTAAIAAKLPLAGGTLSGDLTTAADVNIIIQGTHNEGGGLLDLKGTDTPAAGKNLGAVNFGNSNDRSLAMIRGISSAADAADLGFFTEAAGASIERRMTILSTGNVGIGTTSPTKQLTISGADAEFLLSRTGGYADTINMGMPSGVPTIVGGTDLAFGGAGAWTEHMRITSLGTVLVGKQAENSATDGIELNRQDVLVVTRNGDSPLILNRRTSDGDIAILRKDNAVIGSIGVSSGSMYVQGNPATGKVGLTFYGSSIEPRDAGSASNGGVDLGATGTRFKDGHFSGSLYAHSGNFVIATDSGGSYMGKSDNATLRLITNNTTRMTIRNDGGIGIGNNNAGYSSQILSVKSASADEVFYGESTDANCFAVYRDNSSNTNVGFGAIGNDHVFRNDSTEKWRMQSSTGYLIGQSGANIRIVLGSTGNSSNNTSNWVRGNAGYLQFNSASSGYNWEIAGNNKMSMSSAGALTVENGQTYALALSLIHI